MTSDPLKRFRRAAKALKTGYESGSPDALARIASLRPRKDGADLKHADDLHVIAREENFATWPAMKDAIGTLGVDRAQRVQRLKIALHAGQTTVVTKPIGDTPDLAAGHFGLRCALLDVSAVTAMLTEAPELAERQAGPSVPLVHLCKSRMFSVWPDGVDNAIAIARMLVACGVDLDAGSVEHGDPLSPPYWALGQSGGLRSLMEDWAQQRPGQVVAHGIV